MWRLWFQRVEGALGLPYHPARPPVNAGGTARTGTRAMDPHEIYEVETTVVGCDGGGALGHPLVYLNMEGRGAIDCPYCGRKYVLKTGAKSTAR